MYSIITDSNFVTVPLCFFDRYLKSQFPVVDETVLLDTLCRSENNVHKASEELLSMGFSKKGDNSSKLVKKLHETPSTVEKELKPDSVFIPLRDPSPNLKSYEDKAKSTGDISQF